MPERYSPSEKEAIKRLQRQLFNKIKEDGVTYRQVGALVKAQPSTIWRWAHGKSWPSQHHIFHIKRFLGIVIA